MCNYIIPLGLLIGNFSYPLGLYWLVLPPGYTRYPLESIVLEVGDHFFIFELDEPKNRKQRKQDNPSTYVNWWTPLTFWVPEENVPRYQRFSWQMVRQSIPKVYPTIITWLWRTYTLFISVVKNLGMSYIDWSFYWRMWWATITPSTKCTTLLMKKSCFISYDVTKLDVNTGINAEIRILDD